jgi:hypothetical protein
MLPALEALTTSLADSAKSGEGWKTFGQDLGNTMVQLAINTNDVASAFKKTGIAIGGVAAAFVQKELGNHEQARAIIQMMKEDINAEYKAAVDFENKMKANLVKSRVVQPTTPEERKAAQEREANLKRAEAALKAITAAAEKADKKVKDIKPTSEALTATQDLMQTLLKGRDEKITALEQLEFLSQNADMLERVGVSAEDIASAFARLQKASGTTPPFAELIASLEKTDTQKNEALKQLEYLTDNAEHLAAAGVSIETITAAIIRLQQQTGTAPPLAAFKDSLAQSVAQAAELPKQIAFLEQSLVDLEASNAQGSMTWEVYTKALKDAKDAQEKLGKAVDETQAALDVMGHAIGGILTNSISSMTDALFDNSKSWEEWTANLLKQIGKALVQLAALQAFMIFMRATFPNAADFLFGAVKKAKGGACNTAGVETFAQGGAFHNSILKGITPFMLGGSFRSLAVAGEAGPEAVVPLKRTSSGDLGVQASPVNIVVNNTMADTAHVDIAETNKPDGSKQITMTIRREMRAALSDGSMDTTMRGNYGLSRKAVR